VGQLKNLQEKILKEHSSKVFGKRNCSTISEVTTLHNISQSFFVFVLFFGVIYPNKFPAVADQNVGGEGPPPLEKR
jgi:hypothetical protein